MEPQLQTPSITTKQFNKKLILIAILGVVIVLFIIVAILLLSNQSNSTNQNNQSNSQVSNQVDNTTKANQDKGLIKHLGIDLDYYNKETGTAGDIVFSEKKLGQFDVPFFDYGFRVPATSVGPAKLNPQPTFIVPLGTKVHSLVDGTVINIPKLYSNDYSIHVSTGEDSNLIFETEHVINPLVVVGQKVKAGDVIAEVSDYDAHNYSGFGLYEIGILIGGNPPSHVCVFNYLDESIKEDTFAKLRSLYKGWNEFRGVNVYNENLQVPGCLITDAIEG